jgi:hypothetical protein
MNAATQATSQSNPPAGPELEIWLVLGHDNKLDSPARGLLITTADRLPSTICFIDGFGQPELLSAQLIAAGKRSPEMAMDLRGRPLPELLFGRLLIPTKFLGKMEREQWPFLGAMFMRHIDHAATFMVLVPAGFGPLHRRTMEAIDDPHNSNGGNHAL